MYLVYLLLLLALPPLLLLLLASTTPTSLAPHLNTTESNLQPAPGLAATMNTKPEVNTTESNLQPALGLVATVNTKPEGNTTEPTLQPTAGVSATGVPTTMTTKPAENKIETPLDDAVEKLAEPPATMVTTEGSNTEGSNTGSTRLISSTTPPHTTSWPLEDDIRIRTRAYSRSRSRCIPPPKPGMDRDPDENAVAARLLWIWTELEGQLGSPAGRPFYGDVVIVCVDCEGWQSNSHIRTSEIGVTLFDTRELHDIPIDNWEHQVHSFHFRTTELMKNRPVHWGKGKCNPDKFYWGTTQIIPTNDRAFVLDTFF